METIEQAYKILGLHSGASLRQVDEAYRDLRALWDPERLSDNPRLRSQAIEKKQEVEDAYEAIIEHLSRKSQQKTGRTPKVELGSASGPASDRPSANLFEDAFSDRVTQGGKKVPVWAVFLLIAFAGVALGYFALGPNGAKSEAISAAAQEDEESELARVVEKVRGRYTESENQLPDVATPETNPIPKVAEPPKPAPKPSPPKSAPPKVQVDKSAGRPDQGQQIAAQKQIPPPPPKKAPELEQEERPPSDRPLLLRDEIPTEEEIPSEQVDDGPPKEHLDVFKTLLKESATASKLVQGEIGTLNFAEWSIIQQTASETWVDLVATWASGQEVHFFWSVNPSTGGVRPLNQAARNLESTLNSP